MHLYAVNHNHLFIDENIEQKKKIDNLTSN